MLVLLGIAGALGLFHTSWSAYWAAGGTVMVESLGSWALDWARTAPATARAVLWAITLVKLAATLIPVLVELGLLPPRRFWRALEWAGGSVLVLYGGANTVVGAMVLAGAIPSQGAELGALRSHVLIWDPAFALWGVSLVAALALSRGSRRA